MFMIRVTCYFANANYMKRLNTLTLFAGAFFCMNIVFNSCSENINENNGIAITGNCSNISPTGATITCNENLQSIESSNIEFGVICSSNINEIEEFKGDKKFTKNLVGNSYVIELNNLKPNNTYYYRAYVYVNGIYNYGTIKQFTTLSVNRPETSNAIIESPFSVILNAKCNISEENIKKYAINCKHGIVYSTDKEKIENNGIYLPEDKDISILHNKEYSARTKILSPNTTYYYKAYVCINGEYLFGNTKEFTTQDFTVPVINSSNNISPFNVEIHGYLEDISSVASVGVKYSKSESGIDSQYTSNKEGELTNNGFVVSLEDLAPNTSYTCKPYVIIKDKHDSLYLYGEGFSFTTQKMPTPEGQIINIGAYSAEFNVTTPNYATEIGVQYSTSKDNIDKQSQTKQVIQGTNSADLLVTNLTPNTKYYYRFIYKTHIDRNVYTAYSDEINNFTTKEAPYKQNLLSNGGFEIWSNGIPTGWKSASTASTATLAQSTDAHAGTYSVIVKGDEASNKRLASAEMTLEAGTYEFTFYVKATDALAQVRPGYVPVTDGKVGSYFYGDYATISTSWGTVTYTFELKATTTICLVVMNPKKSSYSAGKDVLIDDAVLIKK